MPHARLLRPDGRVTNIELFFDLVFVFAVTQLSHTLVRAPVRPRCAADVGAARPRLAVVDLHHLAHDLPQPRPSRRAAAAAADDAGQPGAGHRDPGGVRPRAGCCSRSPSRRCTCSGRSPPSSLLRGRELRLAFVRILPWSVVSSALVVAGAVVHGDARLLTWVVAIAVDVVGAAVGFWLPRLGRSTTTDWAIAGDHFAERCQGFVLIALGESIVVTGSTLAAVEHPSAHLIEGAVAAFAGAAALWWVYFDRAAGDSAEVIAASADPGRLGRSAFHWIHPLIVAGIIVTAGADEVVLDEPDQRGVRVARAGCCSAASACSCSGTRCSRRSSGAACRGRGWAGWPRCWCWPRWRRTSPRWSLGFATLVVVVAVCVADRILHPPDASASRTRERRRRRPESAVFDAAQGRAQRVQDVDRGGRAAGGRELAGHAVHVRAGRGGQGGRQAGSQQRADQPAQHVAAAGGAEPRRAGGVDVRACRRGRRRRSRCPSAARVAPRSAAARRAAAMRSSPTGPARRAYSRSCGVTTVGAGRSRTSSRCSPSTVSRVGVDDHRDVGAQDVARAGSAASSSVPMPGSDRPRLHALLVRRRRRTPRPRGSAPGSRRRPSPRSARSPRRRRWPSRWPARRRRGSAPSRRPRRRRRGCTCRRPAPGWGSSARTSGSSSTNVRGGGQLEADVDQPHLAGVLRPGARDDAGLEGAEGDRDVGAHRVRPPPRRCRRRRRRAGRPRSVRPVGAPRRRAPPRPVAARRGRRCRRCRRATRSAAASAAGSAGATPPPAARSARRPLGVGAVGVEQQGRRPGRPRRASRAPANSASPPLLPAPTSSTTRAP